MKAAPEGSCEVPETGTRALEGSDGVVIVAAAAISFLWIITSFMVHRQEARQGSGYFP
jgi:hypothetical protein